MFTARFNDTRDGVASSTGSVYLSGVPCLFSIMEIKVIYEICQFLFGIAIRTFIGMFIFDTYKVLYSLIPEVVVGGAVVVVGTAL